MRKLITCYVITKQEEKTTLTGKFIGIAHGLNSWRDICMKIMNPVFCTTMTVYMSLSEFNFLSTYEQRLHSFLQCLLGQSASHTPVVYEEQRGSSSQVVTSLLDPADAA